MDNRSKKPEGPDLDVPACFGCERDFRVQSLAPDEKLSSNKWTARQASIAKTSEFYERSMRARGWELSKAQQNMDKIAKYFPEIRDIPGRSLSMERDGSSMMITVLPNPNGGADVFSLQDQDGQMLSKDPDAD
jgi:hypothetical protein